MSASCYEDLDNLHRAVLVGNIDRSNLQLAILEKTADKQLAFARRPTSRRTDGGHKSRRAFRTRACVRRRAGEGRTFNARYEAGRKECLGGMRRWIGQNLGFCV